MTRAPEPVDPAVAAAVLRLLPLCATDDVRLEIQKRFLQPGVQLLACVGDDYLFKVPMEIREEYQHYRFFFMGRVVEIRRMGFCTSEYSLVEFPAELDRYRTLAQERFAALSVTTEDGLGWLADPARWQELTEAQKATFKPTFVEDGLRYCSM